HGRRFAKVTPQYERIASSNAVILVFKIEEGPKVKVGKIKFKGNHAFSDRKLIRAMRHDRPYAIPLYFWYIPVLTKTYDREKLSEDLEVGVRGLYRDNGYFKVSVGEPVLENIDTTHDKVIRRELMIDEGQLFNKRLWELSILRLNQLDYFDKIEADKAAEIKRSKEGTVDINLKLKEKGKQSIGLQGGVSGLAGSF